MDSLFVHRKRLRFDWYLLLVLLVRVTLVLLMCYSPVYLLLMAMEIFAIIHREAYQRAVAETLNLALLLAFPALFLLEL